MAEVKVVQDERDGSLWAEMPGGRMRSVTEDQATQIYKNPGTFENILGAAGEATTGLMANAANMLGMGGETEQQAATRANQKLQARGMISPISTMAGQAIPYGAGEAAGFAAAGPIGAAAVGGAMGAAGNPDAPLMGAAMGAAPGLIGAGAMRMADRVLGKVDNITATRPKPLGVSDDMGDFVRRAEAEGLQVPASVKYESQAMENLGLQLESSPLTSWMTGGTANNNARVLGERVNEAVGLAAGRTLTPQVLREAEAVTSKSFRELADSAGTAMTKDQVRESVNTALAESFVDKGKFLKKVDKLLGDFGSDTLSTDNLMSFQSSLGDLSRKAKGGTRMQISNARDAIIDAIPATPGQEQAFQVAREQWAAQRAVADSLGARSTLSASKLAKRITARQGDTPIAKLGRVAEAMNYMRPTKYGTENVARGGLTGTVMTGAAMGGAGGMLGGAF